MVENNFYLACDFMFVVFCKSNVTEAIQKVQMERQIVKFYLCIALMSGI